MITSAIFPSFDGLNSVIPSPPATRLQLAVGRRTQMGLDHARNEDCCGVVTEEEGRQAWGSLACLADGIGGCADGRLAAELTVRTLLTDYYATPLGLSGVHALYRVADSVNGWLFRQGRFQSGGLGTTLVAALFRNRTLSILNVGDSRLYRWRSGRLTTLTRDHLFGGPEMSILTKAVGLDDPFTPDTLEEVLQEGDRYVLLSDGVWRELSEATIRQWVGSDRDPEAMAAGLVAAAHTKGRDDCTAMVVTVLTLPAASFPDLEREWLDRPVLAPPGVGETIDGFRIRGILFKGMQGVVAIAWDEENKRDVVLKFPDLLAAVDPTWLTQFAREEWIGLQVRHPNVVQLLPQPPHRRHSAYHVWEWLEGDTLEPIRSQRGKQGVTTAEVARWMQQGAKGLMALHRLGIVHRDVKPDNLFLTHDQRLVLLDFGMARITGLSQSEWDTAGPGNVGGTPGFMAPELYDGEPGDPLSDLFALGVTGYLLLTGRFPYGQPESHRLRPSFDPFTPLTIVRPDVPPSLAAVIERCLAIKRQERPGDLGEFLSWLEQPELWPDPVSKQPWLERNAMRFYQVGFWIFFLTTLILLLLRIRG